MTRILPRMRNQPRSPLGWFILGAVLMVIASAGILDKLGAVYLLLGQYPALALLIVGIGLLIGCWWGRSRLFTLVGVALIPAVVLSSLVDFPLEGKIDGSYISPRRSGSLPESFRRLAGRSTVDLSRTKFEVPITTMDLAVAVGSIHVVVPRDIAVDVHSRVGVGDLYVFDAYRSGKGLAVDRSFGSDSDGPVLRLNIEGGWAHISIQRALRTRRDRANGRHRKEGSARRNRVRAGRDADKRKGDRTERSTRDGNRRGNKGDGPR